MEINSEWGDNLILKCNSNGIWNGQLETPEAGGPYFIDIISNKDTVKINNVLIGEVWVASGQSNMEMNLKGYPNEPILNSESKSYCETASLLLWFGD